jgi:hypothetical protein
MGIRLPEILLFDRSKVASVEISQIEGENYEILNNKHEFE